MSFLLTVLDPPSYGWKDNTGLLYKPSAKEIFSEFFKRLNVYKTKKNWLGFFSWMCVLCLLPTLLVFIYFQITHFSLVMLLVSFVYGMILMGTHGTIWYHRYCTHQAYSFRNKFWRFITANLVIKLIPEEIYVVSHHVHHALSDQPGDPYNAEGGFLYCFLADVNHQPISKQLTEAEYNKVLKMMSHTGAPVLPYKKYQKWGSASSPVKIIAGVLLNWIFWFCACYFLGGIYFTMAVFAGAFVWSVGVRTFNYEGHGKGIDCQVQGKDFNERDKSINQLWPGIVAGEWHNNHHLYPKSARSGFLPHQVDFAWYYIWLLKKVGAVTVVHDDKKRFMQQCLQPYKANIAK